MNYIELELLRQKKLMLQLFAVGDEADTPEPEGGILPYEAGEAMGQDVQRQGVREAEDSRPYRVREADLEGGGSARSHQLPAVSREEAPPGTGGESGVLPSAGGRRSVQARETAASRTSAGVQFPADDSIVGQAEVERLSGGMSAANTEGLEAARAVSLYVERDARRYDGGYPLY